MVVIQKVVTHSNLLQEPSSVERETPLKRRLFDAHVAARQSRLGEVTAGLLRDLGDPASLTLDLGCGHGHFLSSYAAAHPEESCLGIDFSSDRIERATRKQKRARAGNLRFLCGEIQEAIETLPKDLRIGRVFILYPDPWPKRRHRKNRLMSEAFIEKMADHCASGAMLFFRTDSEDYFEQTRVSVLRGGRWEIPLNQEWPHDCATVFEQRMGRSRSLVAVRSG